MSGRGHRPRPSFCARYNLRLAIREMAYVFAATGSKMILGVDPVDTDPNTVAVERLLRTAQGKVDESEDERMIDIEWLNTLTESTYAASSNFAKTLHDDITFRWPERDQATRFNKAVQELETKMGKCFSLESKLSLLDDVSERFDNSALVYALAHLKVSKIESQENLAAEFSKLYFEKLIFEGTSPLDVLPLWIDDVDKDLAVTKGPVIMLLEEFISFSGSQTTMLKCFENYYGNDNELALALSRGKYHGSKAAAVMQQEVVGSYETFDQVFDICKPLTDDKPWNFDMLNEFAIRSKERNTLLSLLRDRFEGNDKLAPKLAEAKKEDEAAELLQKQLVQDYLNRRYSMEDVARDLQLNKNNLSSSNLDTFRLFARMSDSKSAEKIDWRKKLAEFLDVDENTILTAEKKGRAERGQEDMKVSDHMGTED